MHALLTEGVPPVNNIKNNNKHISIIFDFLLLILILFNIKFTAIIIYETCIPDTANICDKLLILKLFFIFSFKSFLFPNNIAISRFDSSSSKICLALFDIPKYILFDIKYIKLILFLLNIY